MRRLLLSFLALAFASVAQAGSVTITVVGTECTGTTCQAVFTIPNAVITRYINAYKATLGQVQVDPLCVNNPGGSPPVICALRDRTAPETVRGWAKGIMQGTINNVVGQERQGASKTAADAILDVTVPDPQ